MAKAPFLFVLGSFVVACSAKVPRQPRPGESLAAESLTVEPGGKGFNVAVGARRLGIEVDGLFGVGSDPLAAVAEGAFAEAGLPPTLLRRFEGPTGAGIGFTDRRGENRLAVHPGANLRLGADDVCACADRIGGAALVTAQFEIADAPILAAFDVARRAGRPTLLNPSPYRPLDPALLARSSILVVNRVEARQLGRELRVPSPPGRTDAVAAWAGLAGALLRAGPETVVITLGADGAMAFRRDGPPTVQAAYPVAAIDTLGAGDAFVAGLAASLVRGESLAAGLRTGAACGALVAARLGVLGALPTAAAVETLLSHP